MQILIIEDHKCVSSGLELIIKHSDMEAVTDTADSLAEAREKLGMSANSIDIVILDINLPDGDGLEFCKEIKHKLSRHRRYNAYELFQCRYN
ncbi:hypothetical protein FACS1894178_7510 [Bacteroidia bacterium]|nr:hypothetical protein FACS1894178_7510 [Bacteroidia bacterium]